MSEKRMIQVLSVILAVLCIIGFVLYNLISFSLQGLAAVILLVGPGLVFSIWMFFNSESTGYGLLLVMCLATMLCWLTALQLGREPAGQLFELLNDTWLRWLSMLD